MPEQKIIARDAGEDPYSLICFLLGAGVICIIARGILLLDAHEYHFHLWDTFILIATMAVYSLPDLAVLFSAGVATLAARALVGRTTLRLAITLLGALLGYAVMALALVNLRIVPMYRGPLTVQLVEYSRVMSDSTGRMYLLSLVPVTTVVIVAVAVAVPVLAALLCRRWLRRRVVTLVRKRRVTVALGALGLACAGAASSALIEREWDSRYFANGLVELALSAIEPPVLDAVMKRGVPVVPVDSLIPEAVLPLPRNRPRNLVFFVIESASARYLSRFGGSHPLTPNLDRLLANGIRFEHAYAHAPASTISLVSLLNSRVALTAGMLPHADAARWADVSLQRLARRHGMRTAYFSGGQPYDDELAYLRARDFDRVEDIRSMPCPGRPIRNGFGEADDRCALQALLRWIDREPGRPFFAVQWNFQSHHPYAAHQPQRTYRVAGSGSGWNREEHLRYLNALRETDATLGALVDGLRQRGLDRSTLIVVTGDHGESFGQHGISVHGSDVFEESVRIPLAFLYPGFAGALRHDGLVGTNDVLPTVAHIMGLPQQSRWAGTDLFAGVGSRRVHIFATGSGGAVLGYREGSDKFLMDIPKPAITDVLAGRPLLERGRFLRFDLARDPAERNPLTVTDPALKARIQALSASWLATASLRAPATDAVAMAQGSSRLPSP